MKNHEMAEYGLRSMHVSCLYYLYSAESLTAEERKAFYGYLTIISDNIKRAADKFV